MFSCVDFDVRGGAVYNPRRPSLPLRTIFVGGDATFSDTCWQCDSCLTSFHGGPSLAQLTEFRAVQSLQPQLATSMDGEADDSQAASESDAFGSDTNACPAGFSGIRCFPTDCCSQFVQCLSGFAFPVQQVAPGTLCKGGMLVHPYQCPTVNACGQLPLPSVDAGPDQRITVNVTVPTGQARLVALATGLFAFELVRSVFCDTLCLFESRQHFQRALGYHLVAHQQHSIICLWCQFGYCRAATERWRFHFPSDCA